MELEVQINVANGLKKDGEGEVKGMYCMGLRLGPTLGEEAISGCSGDRQGTAFVTRVGQWELWEPRTLTWAGEKVMHHIKGVTG